MRRRQRGAVNQKERHEEENGPNDDDAGDPLAAAGAEERVGLQAAFEERGLAAVFLRALREAVDAEARQQDGEAAETERAPRASRNSVALKIVPPVAISSSDEA